MQSYLIHKMEEEVGPAKDCPDASNPVAIHKLVYGDLDGDGRDDVAVMAFSCYAGKIPDLYTVVKVGPGNKLTEMPFAPVDPKRVFPHMDPKADARGPQVDTIENGRLISAQAIYRKNEPECCPTGGARQYFYHWDGHMLVLDDVVDTLDSP